MYSHLDALRGLHSEQIESKPAGAPYYQMPMSFNFNILWVLALAFCGLAMFSIYQSFEINQLKSDFSRLGNTNGIQSMSERLHKTESEISDLKLQASEFSDDLVNTRDNLAQTDQKAQSMLDAVKDAKQREGDANTMKFLALLAQFIK